MTDTATAAGGCIAASIQRCPGEWGVIFFVLNCILPGFGTMFSSLCDTGGCNVNAFGVGFLQLCLTPVFFIGWIWSIIWGWKIYEKSK